LSSDCRRTDCERDHRAHPIRHHLGELTRIEAAKTPADQADLAAIIVVELLHQIDHRPLHAFAEAKIAALTPAADGIAAVLQKAAQRTGRRIGRHQPGQHQHRMTVAPGARLSSGNAPRNAPSSWMARPSRNIRVPEGGRSVWAVADMEFPLMAGPRAGA